MAGTPDPRGRIDQRTRRSGTDATQGNWCSVNVNDPGVIAAFQTAGYAKPVGTAVYIEPVTLDVNNYPVTAAIRPEQGGESGGTSGRVVVPYSALSVPITH